MCFHLKRFTLTTGLVVLVFVSLSLLFFHKSFERERGQRTEEKGKAIYFVNNSRCINDFQVIEKNLAFAYSAYIDDRRARDNVDMVGPVVRIFLYFDRAIKAANTWQCLFWYKDKVDPVPKPVKRITNLNTLAEPRFMPAMALCALPENDGQKPHSVSLVPKSKKSSLNFICIEDLRIRRNSFLENTNEYSKKKPSSKGNIPTFTICTKAVHDEYYNVHDIVNFIEVNRILGAEKFIFYADKKIANLAIKQCLDSYSERGIVEIYTFSPPVLESLIYHGQIITMTECMYRAMYRTKFVINKDLDEFIVPRIESNWNEMLVKIHNKTTNSDRIASYNFRNQFFPRLKEDDPNFTNNTLAKLYRITTLLQTLKEDYIFPHTSRSKVMARPEKLLIWHMHLTLTENLINKGNFIYNVHPDDAFLFHYRQWTTSAKLIRERRMHEFNSRLIENIHFALGHCLPPN